MWFLNIILNELLRKEILFIKNENNEDGNYN